MTERKYGTESCCIREYVTFHLPIAAVLSAGRLNLPFPNAQQEGQILGAPSGCDSPDSAASTKGVYVVVAPCQQDDCARRKGSSHPCRILPVAICVEG